MKIDQAIDEIFETVLETLSISGGIKERCDAYRAAKVKAKILIEDLINQKNNYD